MSTSSSNLELNFRPDSGTVPRWKQELNERLAATRARHSSGVEEHASLPSLDSFSTKQESRASRLAARVAERYANAPSYSEVLAAEARAAAFAAEAAVAAAEEARDRAQALLAGLETPSPRHQQAPPVLLEAAPNLIAHPVRELSAESISESMTGEVALELGEAGLIPPVQPLPVNLIEFPRELVATRRARPRLEEGPLRESFEEPDGQSLRIFEAEPNLLSPAMDAGSAAAEWSSIRLDAKALAAPAAEERRNQAALPVEAAPLEDRLLAALFDGVLVLIAFVLCVLALAAGAPRLLPTGRPALFCAGLALGALFLLYQYLFFQFGESTPGMRYAKIALCTFDDENPTRAAMRRRIAFLLLSAAPLGLGLVWAWFDQDRLAWHDRLSRMYQRSCR